MTSHESAHPDCSENVAAYVLHAMDAAERAAFEAHLETCASCARDVVTLAPVIDALGGAVPQYEAPPELKARVMSVVESEAELLASSGASADRVAPARRTRGGLGRIFPRPAFAAGVAAVALACGVVAGVVITGDAGSPSGVRTLAARITPPGSRATLTYGDAGGTLHVAGMTRAPSGHVYQVWLQRRRGAPVALAVMRVNGSSGHADVAVPGNLGAGDQIMVTSEPRAGQTAPTSLPLLVASVTRT